jgi:hypothetical protein
VQSGIIFAVARATEPRAVPAEQLVEALLSWRASRPRWNVPARRLNIALIRLCGASSFSRAGVGPTAGCIARAWRWLFGETEPYTLIGASPTGLQGQTPERAVRPLATRRQSQHGYGPLREHILDFPKADKPKLAVDPSSIGAVRTSSAVPSWLTLL